MSDFEEPETTDELHEALSTVYHDLNNPLSIISGNAQFLEAVLISISVDLFHQENHREPASFSE